MFIKYGQNVNKHTLMDEAILGKMCAVYVTYVADVENQQWQCSNTGMVC